MAEVERTGLTPYYQAKIKELDVILQKKEKNLRYVYSASLGLPS